jgi:T4 RnlA family RNA ligase
MEVIKFLQSNANDFSKLTLAFGIKVKDYPEQGIVVLNYDQIESPKMDPVVVECRGLILDYNLNVLCRPFDRFFNYGEAFTDKMDLTGYTYQPKLDGSLIKVYWLGGSWRIATRGTAFAESDVGGWGITFEELTLRALGFDSLVMFSEAMEDEGMPQHYTCLLELTAMENRVVTYYSEPSVTLLAVRNNQSGDYAPAENYATYFWKTNSVVSGLTIEDIIQKADSLKNLEEGFVGYDQQGVPRIKIKSAAYVAVHHIRGEGLNPKRVAELVISGEEEEYLTYFPEDRDTILPYSNSLSKLISELEVAMFKNHKIKDQKEFALAIKDVYSKSVLFTARKLNIPVAEAFHGGTMQAKVKALLGYSQRS